VKLYYNGQFEGKRIKLPVQLGKEPEERISKRVQNYYYKILEITNCDIFKKGKWVMLEPVPAADGNISYNNFLSWIWEYSGELRIVVINYSAATAQCRLQIDLKPDSENFRLIDLLTGDKYIRSAKEMLSPGLFIELKGYNSHIFSICQS
jgi:hypothetical protein